MESVKNLILGGEESEDFLAIVYGDDKYNVGRIPLTKEKFWTTPKMKFILEKDKEGKEQAHKVEFEKLHTLDRDFGEDGVKFVGVWGKNEKQAERWQSPRKKKFDGKKIFVASHSQTTMDALKSLFQNIGLDKGSEWGSFLYILIIAGALGFGAFFILWRMGFLSALLGL